jgi:hypothetical protein
MKVGGVRGGGGMRMTRTDRTTKQRRRKKVKATHQRDDNVRVPPSLQFLHPALRACEGIGIRDVVHNDGGRGTAVVHGGEGTVPLLPGGVPDFEFHRRIVEGDGLG